jgi:hypothetical protein
MHRGCVTCGQFTYNIYLLVQSEYDIKLVSSYVRIERDLSAIEKQAPKISRELLNTLVNKEDKLGKPTHPEAILFQKYSDDLGTKRQLNVWPLDYLDYPELFPTTLRIHFRDRFLAESSSPSLESICWTLSIILREMSVDQDNFSSWIIEESSANDLTSLHATQFKRRKHSHNRPNYALKSEHIIRQLHSEINIFQPAKKRRSYRRRFSAIQTKHVQGTARHPLALIAAQIDTLIPIENSWTEASKVLVVHSLFDTPELTLTIALLMQKGLPFYNYNRYFGF